MQNSRRLVIAGLGASAAALALWRLWPEQGIVNPCLGAIPPHLANHELVRAAWSGIAPEEVWDCHAHLIGIGDSGSGAWINPETESLLHPLQFARRFFYFNAGCANAAPGRVDESYVERMRSLIDGMRPGVKLLLFAFDYYYGEDGAPSRAASAFYVPNAYARRLAQRHPSHFEWAASIHPYRTDCVAALEGAVRDGARAVKWLPAAMGIDPASPRCDAFYAALARLDVPLITHGGAEHAVPTAHQEFGNPLRLRRALEHGVRVVVAHCATLGSDRDLDRGANGPHVASFELFARLMDDPRFERHLFGDLSALTQINRAGAGLPAVLARREWRGRLLNGSDYPLPGVMPLYSLEFFVERGYLERAAAPVLTEIRKHNALLFDFVLKRHLRVDGNAFAPEVFETREFFAPRSRVAASREFSTRMRYHAPNIGRSSPQDQDSR